MTKVIRTIFCDDDLTPEGHRDEDVPSSTVVLSLLLSRARLCKSRLWTYAGTYAHVSRSSITTMEYTATATTSDAEYRVPSFTLTAITCLSALGSLTTN